MNFGIEISINTFYNNIILYNNIFIKFNYLHYYCKVNIVAEKRRNVFVV